MTEPIAALGDERPWRWHLERACAIVAAVVVPFYLVVVIVLQDPETWSAVRLSLRWQTPAWRVLDWLALSVSLVHGMGSLRRRVMVRSRAAGVACDVVLVAALVIVAAAALRYRVRV